MDFRDELYFLTLTIAQEAGGEPYEGKLGVGYVIMNRGGSVIDTIFKKGQFSCWGDGCPTEQNLDTTTDAVLRECYKAACAAYFRLVPDPTFGAVNYLNEEETRRQNHGALPGWFNESRVTVRIGRHTFLHA